MNSEHCTSLILLRGLPGCGKTTLAHILSEEGKYPVFSVDNYFTDPVSGEYRFNYKENHIAYRQCEDDARNAMKSGVAKVFIDNTFTIAWELDPYFRLASEYGYRVFVVTVENRHGGKTIHSDITDEQILKMAAKYKVVLTAT